METSPRTRLAVALPWPVPFSGFFVGSGLRGALYGLSIDPLTPLPVRNNVGQVHASADLGQERRVERLNHAEYPVNRKLQEYWFNLNE